MTSIDKQIAAIDAELEELRSRKDALQGKRMVTCLTCKRKTKLSTLTYYQVMVYEDPHGCSGGDYWYASHGLFKCPKCESTNSLHFAKNHDGSTRADHPKAEQLTQLKRYFAEIVNVRYERGHYVAHT